MIDIHKEKAMFTVKLNDSKMNRGEKAVAQPVEFETRELAEAYAAQVRLWYGADSSVSVEVVEA